MIKTVETILYLWIVVVTIVSREAALGSPTFETADEDEAREMMKSAMIGRFDRLSDNSVSTDTNKNEVLNEAESTSGVNALRVLARAGTNITLACPGVSPTSYIYLVEWKCLGCQCKDCPNPNGEGLRLLRYNDRLVRWDSPDDASRRGLELKDYGLTLTPVMARDSGTYMCLLNNRRKPDSPIVLTVQDVPEAPPSRPLVVRLDSRSVDLSWAPPRRSHNHPVTGYKIYIKEGESGTWTRTVETGSNLTTFRVNDLSPFTTYMFRVAAENAMGYSDPSKESYPTMTHRELPSGSPRFLHDKISTSSTSLSIIWQPPSIQSLNGEFLGYELSYKGEHENEAKVIHINDNSVHIQNYTLRNLQKHTNYDIKLAAKNLKGVGPPATIELRTEDGVPLEPQRPRFSNITATSIDLSWQPPANAESLGRDLLGYRIYLTEKCSEVLRPTATLDNWRRNRKCKDIPPITVNSPWEMEKKIENLAPYTKYRIILRAFTKKREGPASDALVVWTDSAPPGAPIVTNISCRGNNEVTVSWRRPPISSRDEPGAPIKFYRILLTSETSEEDIEMEVMNDTLKNVAYLSNLTANSAYDLRIVAVVESIVKPGRFYEGPPSHVRKFYTGKTQCDPHHAFSKVPTVLEYNAGIVAGVICTVTGIIFFILLTLVCRHKPSYEFLALTPKYKPNQNGNGEVTIHTNPGAANSAELSLTDGNSGWCGDHESDIPISLFPKHVSGLHANRDMALMQDFEAIKAIRQQSSNGYLRNGNGIASNGTKTYPDILHNGAQEYHNPTPCHADGWFMEHKFHLVLSESPLVQEATWRSIWEQQIGVVVTLLTSVDKDELSTLSDQRSFGDFVITLQNEDILPDCTIRTVTVAMKKGGSRNGSKLAKHGSVKNASRTVTQLIFGRWPDEGTSQMPESQSFLNFVKASFACQQSFSPRGQRVLVHSRNDLDCLLLYVFLESMLGQLASTGDINVASYARHVAVKSGLAFSHPSAFVFVHDIIADAASSGRLHSVLQAEAKISSNGSLSIPI